MKEFKIHFDEERMEDLRRRIGCTRLPKAFKARNWNLGIDDNYLSSLLEYWRNGYDWTQKEMELNQYPQFTCDLNGVTIHFFHIRGSRKGALPLLLTHGWPDSFLRYAKVFPLLSDFDLVVPSLPGFAFSTLPSKGFLNNAEVSEIWHRLMTEVLEYKEYAASGGDMGRGVTCYLAARYPQEVKGIHLTDGGRTHCCGRRRTDIRRTLLQTQGHRMATHGGRLHQHSQHKAANSGVFVERLTRWDGRLDNREVSRLE
ncbi:MAG: epoxide hydrolase [Eubacteriales bacterium]|nr:epoxide hydrolase [Eubacteriales bacterium]